MQKRQQQQFCMLHTLMQLWNERVSLSIRYCYVPATKGFAVIDNMSKNDTKQPWIER